MTASPLLVLDTNVCLDLFVFADPRCTALLDALRMRRCVAVTNANCRAEWQRVLRYPALGLDAARRDAIEADYDALVIPAPSHETMTRSTLRLPRCKDPDDQKFLELARDTGAAALLTRDAALLKLTRRTEAAVGFVVVEPEAWIPA